MRLDEIASLKDLFGTVTNRAQLNNRIAQIADQVPSVGTDKIPAQKLVSLEYKRMREWWKRKMAPVLAQTERPVTAGELQKFFADINYGNSAQQVLKRLGMSDGRLRPQVVQALSNNPDSLLIDVLERAVTDNPQLWNQLYQNHFADKAEDKDRDKSRSGRGGQLSPRDTEMLTKVIDQIVTGEPVDEPQVLQRLRQLRDQNLVS